MHPVTIVLLILIPIQWILIRHWMSQVERGIVSFFKYHIVLLLFSIMVMFSSILRYKSAIMPICHGIFTGLVLISAINLKAGESQESREDIRIWIGGATLLMFGTGAFTLIIHVPDSIDDITYLLGFGAVVFYFMFLWKPR